jgi:hypothetical protein
MPNSSSSSKAADVDSASVQRAKALQAKRDVALAEAEAAEKEAALATKEHDDAAERVRASHAKAAAARAVAAEGVPDADHDAKDVENDASIHGEPRADSDPLHLAVLAHEAAALVHLHAQATNVQNIKNLVHVVLDLAADNYNRWRDQILLVIGKYSLESHVLADLPAPAFPDWVRMDYVVKSWIAGVDAKCALSANHTASRKA